MSYTFAEKKRLRKSFAKRVSVLPVPYLLTTQIESFREFIQEGVPMEARQDVGLQAAFKSIFPISSHSGNARLEYVSYQLGTPVFDIVECQQRGLNFGESSKVRPATSTSWLPTLWTIRRSTACFLFTMQNMFKGSCPITVCKELSGTCSWTVPQGFTQRPSASTTSTPHALIR